MKLAEYVGNGSDPVNSQPEKKPSDSVDSLVAKIEAALSQSHYFFADLLEMFPAADYKTVASAVARLYEHGKMTQDGEGRLQLRAQQD